MAIHGSCLCGGVTFEFDRADGPFEICHCSRCRKVSGAIGLPEITVKKEHFRLLSGAELIQSWSAPILYSPPPYTVTFCSRCGSPVPFATEDAEELGIPAGLLDGDPGVKPDKHIYVEHTPAWDAITDDLPTFTRTEIHKHRTGQDWPHQTDSEKDSQ